MNSACVHVNSQDSSVAEGSRVGCEYSPKVLSPSEGHRLEKAGADFEFDIYKALRDPSHVFLAEVERQGLRAQRCSWWNGYDLSTNAGLKKLLRMLEHERPSHVWFSTECTAFSPLQNINERDEAQARKREQERKAQRKQHTAALIAAYYAHSLGCAVHWEWSRRCRAWRWDAMDEWRKICGTCPAIIGSCQVNVRCPESRKLLGKEWRIESTSPTFAKNIHCPCPSQDCRKNHVTSLGKTLRDTAFYSPEFAKRVVHHMLRDDQFIAGKADMETRQRELQELQDIRWDECQCKRFQGSGPGLLCPWCLQDSGSFVVCEGTGMGMLESGLTTSGVGSGSKDRPEFTKGEREKVMKQLHHLHRATGHGSYESLVKSLEHKRADPRVLAIARDFKCSTCEERKRPTPRRLANLEVNTQRVQVDAAWWAPPSGDDRNKCQFIVWVDEASRFAVGRVFRKDGGGHVTAKQIISSFHELWEPTFGVPELLRADPDGACRSRELDLHFQSLGVETDNIPADAHWKVSIVERSIQRVKELMSKAAVDSPEASHEALLSQALRTWNQREPVRGYSPFQWMLGRAPDNEDRCLPPMFRSSPVAYSTLLKVLFTDLKPSETSVRRPSSTGNIVRRSLGRKTLG